MKVKDFERVIFTPELRRESLNNDYFGADNMVISETAGSGKNTNTHETVKSILDSSNQCEYSIIYVDTASAGDNSMHNTNRAVYPEAPMEYLSADSTEMSYRELAIQMLRYVAFDSGNLLVLEGRG